MILVGGRVFLTMNSHLMSLGSKARVNLVAQVNLRDDDLEGGHFCTGLLTGQKFRLQGVLPESAGCPKITVMNGLVSFY